MPKQNPNPLEKVIETKVCDYAKSLGILCYKFTSPARRSVPDRLFILPHGKGVFFIEFKRRGCVPSPSQEVEIEKIRRQGIKVFVIDTVDDGKALIQDTNLGADCQPQPEFGSGHFIRFHPIKKDLPSNDINLY